MLQFPLPEEFWTAYMKQHWQVLAQNKYWGPQGGTQDILFMSRIWR